MKPVLSIMDAVVGIEGPGPAAGYPRKLGALLASASPYALDAVAVDLIGWQQSDVMMLKLARARGLLPERLEDIEVVGDPVAELRLKRPYQKPTMTAQATLRFIQWCPSASGAVRQGQAIPDKCVAALSAPPHAAHAIVIGRRSRTSIWKCIKCFCCHELAGKGAGGQKRILPIIASIHGWSEVPPCSVTQEQRDRT